MCVERKTCAVLEQTIETNATWDWIDLSHLPFVCVYIGCFLPLLSWKEVRNSRDSTNIDVNCHHNRVCNKRESSLLVFSLYIYNNYFIVRYYTHFDSSWLFHLHKITSVHHSRSSNSVITHSTYCTIHGNPLSNQSTRPQLLSRRMISDMFTNDENRVTPNSFVFVHTCTHETQIQRQTPKKNIYCRVVFFF